MNDKDRKFLALAMGEEWHEPSRAASFHSQATCSCGLSFEDNWTLAIHIKGANRTFDNPSDFFAVWDWAKWQEWWGDFCDWLSNQSSNIKGRQHFWILDDHIDTIRFPQLIVEWLRKEE